MKLNSKNFLMIVALAIVCIVVATYVGLSITKTNKVKNTNSNVDSSLTPKPVSKDTSLDTIETELNETVILEEDFSDL